MAIPTRGVSAPANAAREYHGFDRETLIQAFRIMQMARRIDDREVILKRQNRIWFQISRPGHERIQTAAGLLLRPGEDWFFTYYRDRALALALGVTPEQMLLASVGAAAETFSGGRQMPSHWSDPALHIFTGSSPTGTQFVQAMGAADARRLVNPGSQDLTLCCSGEGATSEGEFWESLNAACLGRLPLVYLIEDNGWAISVPVEQQTAGGSISRLVSGFPNLLAVECDGRDFMDSVGAPRQAIDWVRLRSGPALVHAHVIRPYSHSLSDDERLYKTAAERAAEAPPTPSSPIRAGSSARACWTSRPTSACAWRSTPRFRRSPRGCCTPRRPSGPARSSFSIRPTSTRARRASNPSPTSTASRAPWSTPSIAR